MEVPTANLLNRCMADQAVGSLVYGKHIAIASSCGFNVNFVPHAGEHWLAAGHACTAPLTEQHWKLQSSHCSRVMCILCNALIDTVSVI